MDDIDENWHFEYIVILLLALAGMIVMIVAIRNFGTEYDKKAYDETCNNYIRMNILGNKALLDFNAHSFPCKASDDTVSGSSKYQIMKNVSNDMVKCYNSYFRAKEPMFKSDSGMTRFCSACYKINFTDKKIIISNREMLSFQGLNENPSEKYSEILAPSMKGLTISDLENAELKDGISRQDITKALDSTAVDTSKDYLVLFAYDKKEAPTLFEKIVTGAAIGATGVAIGGLCIMSGGTFLVVAPALIGGGAIAGGSLSYVIFGGSENGPKYGGAIKLVPMESKAIYEVGCEKIMGIEEPGITN